MCTFLVFKFFVLFWSLTESKSIPNVEFYANGNIESQSVRFYHRNTSEFNDDRVVITNKELDTYKQSTVSENNQQTSYEESTETAYETTTTKIDYLKVDPRSKRKDKKIHYDASKGNLLLTNEDVKFTSHLSTPNVTENSEELNFATENLKATAEISTTTIENMIEFLEKLKTTTEQFKTTEYFQTTAKTTTENEKTTADVLKTTIEIDKTVKDTQKTSTEYSNTIENLNTTTEHSKTIENSKTTKNVTTSTKNQSASTENPNSTEENLRTTTEIPKTTAKDVKTLTEIKKTSAENVNTIENTKTTTEIPKTTAKDVKTSIEIKKTSAENVNTIENTKTTTEFPRTTAKDAKTLIEIKKTSAENLNTMENTKTKTANIEITREISKTTAKDAKTLIENQKTTTDNSNSMQTTKTTTENTKIIAENTKTTPKHVKMIQETPKTSTENPNTTENIKTTTKDIQINKTNQIETLSNSEPTEFYSTTIENELIDEISKIFDESLKITSETPEIEEFSEESTSESETSTYYPSITDSIQTIEEQTSHKQNTLTQKTNEDQTTEDPIISTKWTTDVEDFPTTGRDVITTTTKTCSLCTKFNTPMRKLTFEETTKVLTLEVQMFLEKECEPIYYNITIGEIYSGTLIVENFVKISNWDLCTSYNYTLKFLNACDEINNSSGKMPTPNSCNYVQLYGTQMKASLGVWEYLAIFLGVTIIVGVITALFLWKKRKLKSVPEMVVDENEVLIPHVVSPKEFPQHYNKCREKIYILKNEFSTLSKIGENFETTIACLPENKKKNRYVNILPYDCTRVKLQGDIGYINASYIKGYSQHVEYIASQGPLESTLTDFWQMVVQEKVHIIIMVAQFEEHNRNKCFRYIPGNKELMFINDDLQIKCSYELKYDFYTERQIVVQNNKEQLTIVHLQYLNWPDFGCPNGTENMLSFAQTFRHYMDCNYGKALVHCSAGVGRTGTLIAVDILLQTIRDDGDIDIYTVVANLRAQRQKMVQAEEQYLYLYKCVNDFILNPPKIKEIKAVDAIYENVHNIIELQDLVTKNNKNDSNENINETNEK